jgi:SAM-dependent methyltransferase
VAEAFRRGGGVRHADLHPDVWAGTSRFTAQWHRNMLVQQWLPLVPDTTDKLRAGARVADVGCGTGQALIALASDQAAANTGPVATLLYGFSVLYCMTTSLAEGGEGLGTLGLPEPVLRDLAAKAGFAQVRHVEMDNPFNGLYELTR